MTILMIGCGGDKLDNDHNELADLLPVNIDDWSRGDSVSSFDRESIFNYINGAGEVYNSYSFSQVVVARYSRSDASDILVELFDMGNDADAYGAFSYAKEQEMAGIGGGFERHGNTLCFWQDRYYCCVVQESSGKTSSGNIEAVARKVSDQLPTSSVRPALVDALPTTDLIPHSDRYFHLQAALNYNYYLARDNILQLSPNTNCVLARYEPSSTYLLLIEYAGVDEAVTAHASFREGYMPGYGESEIAQMESGKFVGSRQNGRYLIVVLNAAGGTKASQLLGEAVGGLDALAN
jgi:hypothetical protein